MGIFGRAAPAHIETDQVIPLGFLDNTPLMQRILLYNLMVFNDVLDPEKLRNALERLVQQKTWRKMGARLRSNANGGLDYHIPAVFSDERPAIAYTHVAHDMNRADHPLAGKLPTPPGSAGPAIVADPDEFLPLAKGPDCPSVADDYLYSDRPIFGLHIVSFNDSTLVTLHWLHLASDTLGNKAVMENWVRMLEGRDDEVPPQCGFDSDPMADLGKNPTVPHALAKERMSNGQMAGWFFNNIGDLTFRAKENRMVCLPGPYVDHMYNAAMDELKAQAPPGETPFLTENDILTAWCTRLAVSHLPANSEKPVTIQVSGSMRKTLAGDLLPHDQPYVANCFGFMNVLVKASDLLCRPLSHTAAQIRLAVNEQRSREQIEAYHAMFRDQSVALPLFFGTSQTHQVSYSNWTRSDLFAVDFSAAATTPRDTPCVPSYINHSQMPFQFGEGFLFMGKDSHGNYWMCGYRVKGRWANIQKALDAEAEADIPVPSHP
ncbi:hypothetical protein BKA67DRAFT_664502 [Truncatella angustata]|uniref:Uncharacterized protein n=1 Tax=Truncatella angustata TaxID=152316 RepID=A0A9P8UB20_9PEZI|nr:uncharacterized protein BKA67DRAFT_664502 [Truncatella angustata]KAH6645422.1 hypothetical protein BKA67DRAFT_664502 [Truncatella angustata]KAH8198198.1 hypothetical protein TruAng_007625 [Truncatella angustata]